MLPHFPNYQTGDLRFCELQTRSPTLTKIPTVAFTFSRIKENIENFMSVLPNPMPGHAPMVICHCHVYLKTVFDIVSNILL